MRHVYFRSAVLLQHPLMLTSQLCQAGMARVAQSAQGGRDALSVAMSCCFTDYAGSDHVPGQLAPLQQALARGVHARMGVDYGQERMAPAGVFFFWNRNMLAEVGSAAPRGLSSVVLQQCYTSDNSRHPTRTARPLPRHTGSLAGFDLRERTAITAT